MKLGIGFGSLLLLLLAAGYISYSVTSDAMAAATDVSTNVAMKNAATEIARGLWQRLASCRAFLLSGKEEQLSDYQAGVQRVNEAINQLSKMQLDDKEKLMVAPLRQLSDRLQAEQDHAIQLKRDGDEKQALQLLFGKEMDETQVAL